MKYIVPILLFIQSVLILVSLFKTNPPTEQPKYDKHYAKIDSLIESIQVRSNKIKTLETKIDSLTKVRIKSQNIYNTYKIISDEKLKNLPDHSDASIDSLRKLLTK